MKDPRSAKYSNQTQIEVAERVFDYLRTKSFAVKLEKGKTSIEVDTEEGTIFVNVHPQYDSQIKHRNVPTGMRITFSSFEFKLKLKSWLGLSWNMERGSWNFHKEKLSIKTKETIHQYNAFLRRRREKKESEEAGLEKMQKIFPDYQVVQDQGYQFGRTFRISNDMIDIQLEITIDSMNAEVPEFEVKKITVKWDKSKPLDANQVNILMSGTTNILSGYVDNWKEVLAKKGPGSRKPKKGSVKELAIKLLKDEKWVTRSYDEIAVEIRAKLNTKTTAKSIAWYYSKLRESEGLLPRS